VASLYCLELFKLSARLPLYSGFYTIPIDCVIEPWLRSLDLSHEGWRQAHILAYGVLVILNASKWFLSLHLISKGRVKLGGALGLAFVILLLVTFSLRDLPL
jgi:hypothetical protein